MTDAEIARPLEQELQELFGEDSCQLERRPCTGKYRGHTDYTLVFGSGRRLYVGLDQRNYLNGLHDHLRPMTPPFAAARWRSCPMTAPPA